MNVAVIGARRSENGIGEYIAKYFQESGAQVVCVLGTTEETSSSACRALRKYGISARPYHDFAVMVSCEDLQAVAVASPADTHHRFVLACLDKGLSVFCEKPFFDPSMRNISGELDRVFEQAAAKGLTIAMNSQWPFSLAYYEQLCGSIAPREARRFSIRLSPVCSGVDMIPDSVPHALSILHTALGKGSISALTFSGQGSEMSIGFTYSTVSGDCDTSIVLVQEERQPRRFSFGFGGRIANRLIDMETYRISLCLGDRRLPITDPLELSVRDFVQSCAARREPLIGRDHIIATTVQLKQIYDACIVQERG